MKYLKSVKVDLKDNPTNSGQWFYNKWTGARYFIESNHSHIVNIYTSHLCHSVECENPTQAIRLVEIMMEVPKHQLTSGNPMEADYESMD